MENFNKIGCQSWLVGIELLDPRISFDFLKALKNNKIFLKNIEQKIEIPFFNEVKKFGWHIFIKSCLEDCRIIPRHERLPLKRLSLNDNKKVKKFMNNFKILSKKYFKKNYFVKRNLI